MLVFACKGRSVCACLKGHLYGQVDFLLVPTALHHYTIMEVEATEKHAETPSWPFNAKLGKFTNFVNLMDMCAVSVPSGILRCPELDHEDADGEPIMCLCTCLV